MLCTSQVGGRGSRLLVNCAMLMALMAGTTASAERSTPASRQYRDSFPKGVRGFVSADWREKRKTLGHLIGQGKAALPTLISGLQTSQKLDVASDKIPVWMCEVGRHCAIALGEIGDRAAVPALIQALRHPDRDTRREVVIALGKLRDKRAIGPLVKLWADPMEDRTNKRQVALALVSFGKESISTIASANIRGEHERLATAALLRIALRDESAVSTFARENPKSIGVRRCEEALRELHRRQGKHRLPGIAAIEQKARELEGRAQFRPALALWENVIDSGLYSLEEDERAREAMLRIKQKVRVPLFQKPVAKWRNKVFILAKYEADLPGVGTGQARHISYSLSGKEVAIIRQRFRLLEKAVAAGSCGALHLGNDISIVTEPWRLFRPSIRKGSQHKDRFQITRKDLDEKFHYRERYLAPGIDCVFFLMRGDLKTFEIDGGAAGGNSVLNAQSKAFDDMNIVAQCHEWLHMLHGTVWTRGGLDWMQCLPLHDQLRELQLRKAWQTGRFPGQEDVFVEAMQKYVTTRMWQSVERRGAGGDDTEMFRD